MDFGLFIKYIEGVEDYWEKTVLDTKINSARQNQSSLADRKFSEVLVLEARMLAVLGIPPKLPSNRISRRINAFTNYDRIR